MLKTVVAGGKSARLLIIEDENSARGGDLFGAVLRTDVANEAIKKIHLCCVENPPSHYSKVAESSKIDARDLFNAPLSSAEDDRELNLYFDDVFRNEDLIDSSCFVDSLDMLFLYYDADSTLAFLHELKERFRRVVCVVHRDLVEDARILRKVEFLSEVVLRINCKGTEVSNTTCGARGNDRIVELFVKKTNGKISRQKETFAILEDYKISSKIVAKQEPAKNTNDLKDIMKNLTTFRLGLDMGENEKAARDNLVLPYIRNEKKPESGQIVYYAEAADDLEEDPDDDLDI